MKKEDIEILEEISTTFKALDNAINGLKSKEDKKQKMMKQVYQLKQTTRQGNQI